MSERVRNRGVWWQGRREREDIGNDGQSLIKWQLLAWPTETRFNWDCNENSQEVFVFFSFKGIPFCFTELYSLVTRDAVIPLKGQNQRGDQWGSCWTSLGRGRRCLCLWAIGRWLPAACDILSCFPTTHHQEGQVCGHTPLLGSLISLITWWH